MLMMGERTYKKRLRELPGLAAELRNDVVQLQRARWMRVLKWAVGLGAICVGFGLLSIIAGVVLGMIACVVLLFVAAGSPQKTYENLIWTAELLDALAPELHPRARLYLRLDLRRYDDKAFLTRSYTSSRGRAKSAYRSRWFTLETTLADGTYLMLERTSSVKTKSGAVTADRRKLTVSGRANPRRYKLADRQHQQRRLDVFVQAALVRFHDRPEGTKLKPAPTTADRFGVQVVQDDAPFLVREVIGVIGALVAFLGEQRVDQKAA